MVKLPKLGGDKKRISLPAKGETTVPAVVFENMETWGMVKRFLPRNVSDGDLNKLLAAATLAHSTGDRAPWEFIIVRNPGMRQQLAETTERQAWISGAPVLVVICTNEKIAGAGVLGERGKKLYAVQDVAAAGQNILLAANALGLAASWVGEFKENKVAITLHAPEWIRPQAIIAIGWPAEAPEPAERHSNELVVHDDTFGKTRHVQRVWGPGHTH